jgi:hypothetical protein
MEQSDIVTIDIDDDMRAIARDDEAFFAGNHGKRTRALSKDRDFVGSLAHQAADAAFEQYGMEFTSLRTDRKPYGERDACDILYDQDTIDVKGHKGLVDSFFYNIDCLVLDAQLFEAPDPNRPNHRIWPELISHILFVNVSPDYERAWILGVISQFDFLKYAGQRTLTQRDTGESWPAHFVKSRALVPLRKYIFRV